VLLEIIKHSRLDVPVIEFQVNDIVRGELCRQFIVAWDAYENER